MHLHLQFIRAVFARAKVKVRLYCASSMGSDNSSVIKFIVGAFGGFLADFCDLINT